ncbi:MAG: LON peptidase substrate-binding domain-containing protein [Anaerolineae bacterium]
MLKIPLFPLNTVLFPGMPLRLHIFEERYKLMIQRCMQESLTFGVVLIQQGTEALGPLAQPYQVGCTAQITQVERLSMGRMNIMAVGKSRFKIESLDDSEPFLMGNVDLWPLFVRDREALRPVERSLRHWVGRYLRALESAGQTKITMAELPHETLIFGYLAATLLQIPARQKQPLLESEAPLDFLQALRDLYRKEVALLDVLLEKPGHAPPADQAKLN